AYAAMDFDPLARVPVWTTGRLTGRSIGRPAIGAQNTAYVLVDSPGGPILDVVRGIQPGATVVTQQVPATLPAQFKPTVWTGNEMLGGRGEPVSRSPLVPFNPVPSDVSRTTDAYDSCTGLHAWPGRAVVSWSGPSCTEPPVGFEVAYEPATGSA